MACNSCQSECMCAIVSGSAGITVTGTGSGADPYRIQANGCGYLSEVPDTNRSVASDDRFLVRNGAGSCELVKDPGFNLISGGSQVTIPPAGNLTVAGANGITASITGNLLLIGFNQTLNCVTVKNCVADMLSNVGFVYNTTLGRFDTTGAANRVLVSNGTGGATWAPGPPATGTITTRGVTLPYGDIGAANGQIEVGKTLTLSAGQGVRLDAGVNSLAFYVRTALVKLSDAGFSCPDTNGMPIYAIGDGLRTLPPFPSARTNRATAGTSAVLATGQAINSITVVGISNPSTCRHANWMVGANFGAQSVVHSGAGKGICAGQTNIMLGGGAFQHFELTRWSPDGPQTAAPEYRFDAQYSISDVGGLAPGATLNYGANGIIANGSTYPITGTTTAALCALVVTT